MSRPKAAHVERLPELPGSYARPPSDWWKVTFDDGYVVKVCNFGDGLRVAGERIYEQQIYARNAVRAVNVFMGWR